MPAGECFPEHHPDRPDVAGRRRRLAAQPLRRDVRERPGHVADRRQRVRLGEAGEAEVEQADRRLRPVLEQDVRRLDVAVDDSLPVRVGQAFEDLRGRLDRAGVRQLSVPRRLAHRRAGDVLVRDVDVVAVARLRVDPLAARMAELRGRARLALGARAGLALARDDLERDVEAVALVACEPHRAGASAAERPDRPVATEDQLAGGEGAGRSLHLLLRFGHARSMSFTGRTKGYSDLARTGSNRHDRT